MVKIFQFCFTVFIFMLAFAFLSWEDLEKINSKINDLYRIEIVTYKVLPPPLMLMSQLQKKFHKILTPPPFLINVINFTVYFLRSSLSDTKQINSSAGGPRKHLQS